MQRFIYCIAFVLQLSQASAYFQQRCDYSISVTLDDRARELSAFAEYTYRNNSPDTLKYLYFHLWPNAYMNQRTVLAKELDNSGNRKMLNVPDSDLGSIDSIAFRAGDRILQHQLLKDTPDVCIIFLDKPLLPGETLNLSTPFRVKIPSAGISRLGHDGDAFYITQWYPKPAVYDSAGWHYFPYLDKGEYYSEYGSFDVRITLPENYVLAATGIPDEAHIAWMSERDSITRLIATFPDDMSFPPSSDTTKTVRFRQDSIHDFAWFADKRWHVLKGEIILSGSEKRITSYSCFTNAEAEYWKKAPEYLSHSVEYGSQWIGEYPYEFVNAVDVTDAEGNGMEYPMITAIGNYGSAFELEVTIAHEVIHNWFYGILGSNERCHPWMDEGLTSYYETRYVYTKYAADPGIHAPGERKYKPWLVMNSWRKDNHRSIQYHRYLANARQNLQEAPEHCVQDVRFKTYQANAYYRAGLTFEHLQYFLGDSLFDAAMHEYYRLWQFRHPSPQGMRQVFEQVSGKNLSWVFDDMLRSRNQMDYKIAGVRMNGDKVTVKFRNSGKVQSPFPFAMGNDSSVTFYGWVDGFSKAKELTLPCAGCAYVRIDPEEITPESSRRNNIIRTKGLLRKIEKPRLTFLTALERPDRTQVFYAPVAGWNYYDKFMGGLVLHNVTAIEKKFEYTLMPMYSTGAGTMTGGGDIRYHFYPEKIFSRIMLKAGFSRYSYADDAYSNPSGSIDFEKTLQYNKADIQLTFLLKRKEPQRPLDRTITLRHVFINRQIPYLYSYSEQQVDYRYYQLTYRSELNKASRITTEILEATWNEDFKRIKGEGNYVFPFRRKNKSFDLRVFAGYASIESSIQPDIGNNYRFSLGGKTGREDFLFDDVFLGRTESTGILSQQFVVDDAGFKTPTYFYRLADQWMAGVNVSLSLPGIIPFRLFADAGTFNDPLTYERASKVSFDAGISLPLIKNIIVIYYPFLYSDDIKYIKEQQDLSEAEMIRFELRLQKLNPLEWIRNRKLF